MTSRTLGVYWVVPLLGLVPFASCGGDAENPFQSAPGGAAGVSGSTNQDGSIDSQAAGGASGSTATGGLGGATSGAGGDGGAGTLGTGGSFGYAGSGGIEGSAGTGGTTSGTGGADASAGTGGTAGAATGGTSSGGTGAASGGTSSGGTAGTGTGGAGRGGTAGGGSGTGGTAGAGNDRCEVAIYDPASPPKVLTLSNRITTFDPSMLVVGDTYYLFSGIQSVGMGSSTDLTNWTTTALLEARPAWAPLKDNKLLLAPDVAHYAFRYQAFYAYFSVRDLAANTACIGHATSTMLTPAAFRDNGEPVLCSKQGDDYTAVFPNVVVDEGGFPWLAFGGPLTPIKIVRVDFDRGVPIEQFISLADSPDAEVQSPFIVRRCGYYYLFVSVGRWCCAGSAPSTSAIYVGRSTNLTGPYVDRSGKPMLEGGGTLVLAGNDRWYGPGHNSVVFTASGAYNVYKVFDSTADSSPELHIAELRWDAEGWPISGGP
jgi:arabinan endo-1,5-alpha-L-arabinosidase